MKSSRNPTDTCGAKRRYFREIDATIDAGRLGLKYKKEFRTYQCPVCEGYHLSTVRTYEPS